MNMNNNNYKKYKLTNFSQHQMMSGGSYTINSDGRVENREIIMYPEVSILIEKRLGSGGSGEVRLGTIIKCDKDKRLIGKQVAIKSFFSSNGFKSVDKKNYEKDKMMSFQLDRDEHLIENSHIASLYFDITTGPLTDCLIYEYGGNTLCSYIGSHIHNLENNKRIMKQLFTILYELSKIDNMQNDIKCDNIVYSVDLNNNVNIKMIDFGASVAISKLNKGEETFSRRTNMNTPETIYNHLKNNQREDLIKHIEEPLYNNFNRWYYYPFISIMCFLFTDIEYSTGNNSGIAKLVGVESSKEEWKAAVFKILLDNNIIKDFLNKHIKEEFRSYLSQLNIIINSICIPIPSKRNTEETIIELLSI